MQQEYSGPTVREVRTHIEHPDKSTTIYKGMIREASIGYFVEEAGMALMVFSWGDSRMSRFLVPDHIDIPVEGTYVKITLKESSRENEIEEEYYGCRSQQKIIERVVTGIEWLEMPEEKSVPSDKVYIN